VATRDYELLEESHMKIYQWTILPVLVALAAATPVFGWDDEAVPRLVVELEAGPLWQSRNDVQIPNDETGTRFALDDAVGRGPWPAGRLYVTWNINSRHGLRALAAPLSVTETGILSSRTRFAGAVFDPGAETEATYKFNSWRLTYRYRFHDGRTWAWGIGFTAKVRDAKIELRQGEASARKTDVGFVPLLHIYGRYRFSERWRVVLDLDALAGGPGRAEDGSLKIHADITPRWSVSLGYRTVEGGADVGEVYNFAWLHYAVVSSAYSF
jgi:hypothetical protein